MRRLLDMNPVLVRYADNDCLVQLASLKEAQGIEFDCPCNQGHRLLIWFSNPVQGEPAPFNAHPLARWQRIGENLEALTLAPSVNAHCWHGFVKDGLIQ